MYRLSRLLGVSALAIAVAAVSAVSAQAQDYYKNKTLTILINYSAGGPTDIEGRLFARHLGKHIPGNPKVIAKNMTGAGGLVAINFLGQKAKPDGLTAGFFTSLGNYAFMKPIRDRGLRVNVQNFEVVAAVSGISITYMRTDVPPGIKKPADIMKAKGFKIAGVRVTSNLDLRSRMALDLLGLNYKYVTGYRGSSKARVAVLQNEVQLLVESVPAYQAKVVPTMVKPGLVIPMWYYGFDNGKTISPSPLAKGIPVIPYNEFHQKMKGKQPAGVIWKAFREINRVANNVQRSVILPPGTPAKHVNVLHAAAEKLKHDPEWQAEAMKTIKFIPVVTAGAKAQAMLRESATMSPDVKKFLLGYIAKAQPKK